MVSLDMNRGSEVLDALERAKLKIRVALWMFLSEYEDWRLVVSARQPDALDLKDAYRLVNAGRRGVHAREDSANPDPSDDRPLY